MFIHVHCLLSFSGIYKARTRLYLLHIHVYTARSGQRGEGRRHGFESGGTILRAERAKNFF